MWEGYRLTFEELSLGSSTSRFGSIKAFSIHSRRQYGWNPFGIWGMSAISSFWKVYKQTASGYASTSIRL
jgi:hypothetical protein